MHLDEEQVQRVLHSELAPPAEEEVRKHLAGCAICRALVDDAQRHEARIYDLLRELDHPLPRIHEDLSRRRWGNGPRLWRLAAAVVVGIIAAGAAYAATGAALPRVFRQVAEWAGLAPRQNHQVRAPAASQPAGRGIAVAAGDRLFIVFPSSMAGSAATISLTDDTDVEVRTLRGQASFTSDLDRLQIDTRTDSTEYKIIIPKAAPYVEVQAGGRQVFRKEGGRVVTQARPDPRGDYLVPLSW